MDATASAQRTASAERAASAPCAASISLEELEAQITELTGHLNAANYRWLMLIEEFDRRQGWADGKLPSCAHWLNFKCGLNLGAAREKVRVAQALVSLPKIAASMGRGELSYSKVRALSRVACAATEENLLMMALHGTAHHVERLVQGYRRAQQAQALSREAQQHVNRSVSYGYAEDGSLVLKARLPALAGALLIQALEAALEATPSMEISAGMVEERPVGYAERRADALSVVAESYLAQPHAAAGVAARASAARSSADRYQVVIHVDAETLSEHSAGRCEIEHGPSLPAETVRRLACDASLIRVLENAHGEPLDVGRKTRSIPPAIRRALNTRDGGCRFPGCTHQRYVDAHHIEHWANGGKTKLTNLVTLCRLHHRLVHEGQIRIETLADGSWRFLHPDGRHFEVIRCSHSPAYEPQDLEDIHAELGIQIDSRTAATRWRGERMDYDLGVWVLCNQANRARRAQEDVAAGTPDTATPDAPSPVTVPWPEEEDTGEGWKPGYSQGADHDGSAEVDVAAGTSDTQPPVTLPWPEEEDTAEWLRPGYGARADKDASADVDVPAGTLIAEMSIEQLLTAPWPDEWWWRPGYGKRPAMHARVDVPAGTSHAESSDAQPHDAQSPVTVPWPEEEYSGEC